MYSVHRRVPTRGLGERIQVVYVKCLALCLTPSKGSTISSLKNTMRAWFQGCQGLPDQQAVSTPPSIPPSYRLLFLCWRCLPEFLPGHGLSQHLRREPSGSGNPTESWLSPAPALPGPCFPQNPCLWVRKFLSQLVIGWSVERGRGWELEKQQLWSQGWQPPIPQGFNCLQIYRPITAGTASWLRPALPRGQGATG